MGVTLYCNQWQDGNLLVRWTVARWKLVGQVNSGKMEICWSREQWQDGNFLVRWTVARWKFLGQVNSGKTEISWSGEQWQDGNLLVRWTVARWKFLGQVNSGKMEICWSGEQWQDGNLLVRWTEARWKFLFISVQKHCKYFGFRFQFLILHMFWLPGNIFETIMGLNLGLLIEKFVFVWNSFGWDQLKKWK